MANTIIASYSGRTVESWIMSRRVYVSLVIWRDDISKLHLRYSINTPKDIDTLMSREEDSNDPQQAATELLDAFNWTGEHLELLTGIAKGEVK